jgi:hypothetical protein
MTDTEALFKLISMEDMLVRARADFLSRLGDTDIIRVIQEAAFEMGGQTDRGADLFLPT